MIHRIMAGKKYELIEMYKFISMQDLYIIGETKSLTRTEITEIEKSVHYSLPTDYKIFLSLYGYGEINELLMITEPDKEYIRSNFSDYMYLWDWKENDELKALNGLTIGKTIDGDIIAVTDNPVVPIMMLPRHQEVPVNFSDFQSVIEYYNKEYKFDNNLYFDTYNEHAMEYIDLACNAKTDKGLIDFLHKIFLEKYQVDKSFNQDKQPKHVIQSIGGWVYFDLLSGSAVRIKYQKRFKKEATEILGFINDNRNN